MFGEQFYPTPKSLIEKMLAPFYRDVSAERWRYKNYHSLENLIILEPSAGKGDILNFIVDNSDMKPSELRAIEFDDDLATLLRDKGYRVIHQDFLTFNESYFFDLIIMNPPFKNGADHLLKAIEIAKDTQIICILNAETIRNPYSEKRKMLLDLINENGTYEFLQEEFTDAERKTNVEIALVRLAIRKKDSTFDIDYDLKDKEEAPDFNQDFINNEIAREDLIGNMNIRYQEVVDSWVEYMKAKDKYLHYENLLLQMRGKDSYVNIEAIQKTDASKKCQYNEYTENLKVFMWKVVLQHLDVKKYMSSKVSKNFDAFVKQHSEMAFTKENVARFFQTLMNNRVNIWETAIADVFDKLTENYYDFNRDYNTGWKTNDRYKINRKVILPNGVKYDSTYIDAYYLKTDGAKFIIPWDGYHKYSDIDKVLDYISGTETAYWRSIEGSLKNYFERLGKVKTGQKYDNVVDSQYFTLKFHKSGTLHMTFKDKKLWDEFNMRACAEKDWLPGPEKQKWEETKKARREQAKRDKTLKLI